MLKTGRINIYFGLVLLMASAFIGFALGQSLEPYFESGYAQIPLWRYLTKAGHTHGMPFGLINIVFGLLLAKASFGDGLKKAIAVLVMLAACLPLGVGLRGVTQGASFAEIIAMVGGFSFLGACGATLAGLAREKSTPPSN